MKKMVKQYQAMYCTKNGSIRKTAEPVLADAIHYLFVRHLAQLNPDALAATYLKQERVNGKPHVKSLKAEVTNMRANPHKAAMEHNTKQQHLMQTYLSTLSRDDQCVVVSAWNEQHQGKGKYLLPFPDDLNTTEQNNEQRNP